MEEDTQIPDKYVHMENGFEMIHIYLRHCDVCDSFHA